MVVCQSRPRGATLPTVLVVASLGFLLAFTLAGTATSQLGFVNRTALGRRAGYLAEAALRKAVADLMSGALPASLTHVRLTGDPEEAEGLVTFDPTIAKKLEIPVSTDNLASEVATRGHGGRTVPAESMHLVGTGRVGGVTRSVEAVLHRPPFPFVLASSGTVRSEGGVLIGSLDAAGDTSPEALLPADLASNSRLEDAVVLGPSSFVAGDLRSAGGVVLDPTSQVKGQTSLYAGPLELPEVDIAAFDPGPTAQKIEETYLAGQRLVGSSRTDADLVVVGDLLMDGGLLFVRGNLTVHGGLQGTGLVAVTGRVRIEGGVSLSGANQTVLLAGNDVELVGFGQETSSFQGMVYTRGSLVAQRITVVGSFVSNGTSGSVSLRDGRAFFDADMQTLDLSSRKLRFGIHDLSAPQVVFLGPTERPAYEFALSVEPFRSNTFGPVMFRVKDPMTGTLRTIGDARAAVPVLADLAYDYARANLPQEVKLDRPDDWTPERLDASEARALQNSLQDLAHDYAQGEVVDREFDLNRFLSLAGQLRILLWRPL